MGVREHGFALAQPDVSAQPFSIRFCEAACVMHPFGEGRQSSGWTPEDQMDVGMDSEAGFLRPPYAPQQFYIGDARGHGSENGDDFDENGEEDAADKNHENDKNDKNGNENDKSGEDDEDGRSSNTDDNAKNAKNDEYDVKDESGHESDKNDEDGQNEKGDNTDENEQKRRERRELENDANGSENDRNDENNRNKKKNANGKKAEDDEAGVNGENSNDDSENNEDDEAASTERNSYMDDLNLGVAVLDRAKLAHSAVLFVGLQRSASAMFSRLDYEATRRQSLKLLEGGSAISPYWSSGLLEIMFKLSAAIHRHAGQPAPQRLRVTLGEALEHDAENSDLFGDEAEDEYDVLGYA